MTQKIIFKSLDNICHKSVELPKNLKHFNFGNILLGNMIKPPQLQEGLGKTSIIT